MLLRFTRWWFDELAALLPARLRERRAAGQWLIVDLRNARLRARLDGPRPRLLLDAAGAGTPSAQEALARAAATVDPRRVRVRVVVPEHVALVRELELPLAAQENLREVLGFEMSRRTPFRVEDVHFDYRVLSHDPAAQRLRVRLTVLPRAQLAPLFAALRDWELEPAHDVAMRRDDDAAAASLSFQAAAYRPRPHANLNLVLGLAAVVLAGIALWLPVQAQREYREALEGQLDQARAAAQTVAVLRERLGAEHEARALLTGARVGQAGMVGLLEVISRALPDGTFLFRLEIARGELNLHGSSDAASSLIAILEATESLHEVRFASPVTRDGASARERFHIVARIDAAAALRAAGI